MQFCASKNKKVSEPVAKQLGDFGDAVWGLSYTNNRIGSSNIPFRVCRNSDPVAPSTTR